MVFLCDKPYDGLLPEDFPEDIPVYPYPLSDFQKYAIEAVIKGHHVLVTAHTGSGKTLPAEFAIQHLTNKGKRVIYTSPIKALSNQKFYEFTRKYPHISFGLLTGDIKTNPTAQVLIMTTEILMNTLFQKDNIKGELSFQMDIETELGAVIFDEVHYINDADRGQTWEQTILMLPLHIQMVMLSATIDNPIGFAEWIENRDKSVTKKVYLASTEHRVVPLTHYGYFATTEAPYKIIKNKEIQEQIRETVNKLILLKTPEGEFKDAGYHEIQRISTLFDKHDLRMKRKFVLNKLAVDLYQQEMLPAIVFVFSRKSVEQSAKDITSNVLEFDSKVPYIMRNECEQIIRRFPNYHEYLELPEYNELVSLLEKGVGIHHSGMIPVLREIVELMISKKYVKLLFATESFAIGLDCPIKTAVFSALRKFDGAQNRFLLPHEYTQMAGRAGRRGIDKVGHVIHCNNLFDLPSLPEYRQILNGKPQKLVSKFKISYSLVLSLLGQHESKIPEFVQKSMLQKELDKTLRGLLAEQQSKYHLYDKRKEALQLNRTPETICLEVLKLEENLSLYPAKKQKEFRRQIQAYEFEYKTFKPDVDRWKEIQTLEKEIKKGEQTVEYTRGYTDHHILLLYDILREADFIHPTDESNSVNQFTEFGQMATYIREIHPLLGVDIIRFTEFCIYSSKEIAIFLSIFTDIKTPEETRILRPSSKEIPNVIKDILKMETRAEYYSRKETEVGLSVAPVEFTYDLVPLLGEWCEAPDELACKMCIQGTLTEAGISVGDFTKALLKIVVIVKEFIPIAENSNDLTFLTNLKGVEQILLKYVATNQSLYV